MSATEHVNYPHEPGYLYDCDACEFGDCQCIDKPNWAQCVSSNCARIGTPLDESEL